MMKRVFKSRHALACLLAAGMLAAGPALAEKPDWAGGGKNDKKEKKERSNEAKRDRGDRDRGHDESRDGRGGSVTVGVHFGAPQRTIIHNYYSGQFSAGRGCPPGLAKKHNGCMPPGQAKKWRVGYVLPRDVVYYDLPPSLVIELGVPPSGHRYVRVAADILLIAVGTGMVVDAIEDLGRM